MFVVMSRDRENVATDSNIDTPFLTKPTAALRFILERKDLTNCCLYATI